MADGIVQIAPDSTGKKVDVSELTVGANTVERQRVNLADPNDPNGLATITNDPPANPDSAYALLVRAIQEDNAYTQELLGQIAASLALAVTPTSINTRGVQVVSSSAVNFNAAVSINQIGTNTFGNTSIAGPTGPVFAPHVPVVLDAGFPTPGIPQHIYGGITV